MNNAYSSYTNIKCGVPQSSIFNTLLFNLDICEILWEYKCDIARYADDNTPYTSDISLNLVLEKLERSTQDFFWWFKENHMKANSGQCHLLPTTNSLTSLNTNGFQITNSNEEKLLGIKFDSELSLENKEGKSTITCSDQDCQLYETFQTKSSYLCYIPI